MLKKTTLASQTNSKLEKALVQIGEKKEIEKSGFVKKVNKTSLFKTKSFRLREFEIENLKNVAAHINQKDERKIYTDSQIIRGIINFCSQNIETDLKRKLMEHIRQSS